QALRQAVLRDLGWLFNATGYGLDFDDRQFPHAARSVLNYGLPMLSGQFTSSVQRVSMEQALKNAILQFEPRILPRTLAVELVMEGSALDSHNRIGLKISGMLWAQPVPLEFLLRSRIDLEEGRIEVQDMSGP
ncbi:MAG: GPW/gp25 family protein, partial [Gammaproteobacteria bacterium]|nr:GPW/gp25 family protein [Gammaproteobacteria bacterium]